MSYLIKTPVAVPFYEKRNMQNQYKENSRTSKRYGLICPYDALLPFQFVLKGWLFPTHIYLCSCDIRIKLKEEDFFDARYKEGYMFQTYYGTPLKSSSGDIIKMKPDCFYWLEIDVRGKGTLFSELFIAKNFSVSQERIPYLKIEVRHSRDIRPLLYSKGFKQVLYMDTYIYTAEPEIEEESEENGVGDIIPLFQRMNSNYKITDLVPNYLKLFLTSLQMHDDVVFYEKNNLDIIRSSRVTCSSQTEDNGSYSKIELTIVTELLSLNACNSHIF